MSLRASQQRPGLGQGARCAWPGLLLVVAALLLLSACAATEDKSGLDSFFEGGARIPYKVELRGVPQEGSLMEDLQAALRLFTLADRPPDSSARIRRRGEADVPVAMKALQAEGYLEARVSFELVELPPPAPVETPSPGGAGEPQGEFQGESLADTPRYSAILSCVPGPRYGLGAFTVTTDLPQALPPVPVTVIGLEPGQPARAVEILAAESRVVHWIREQGFPFARFEGRRSTASRARRSLEVESEFVLGERLTLGGAVYQGLDSVESTYLDTYRTWERGDLAAPSKLLAFQDRLFRTHLFDSVVVSVPSRDDATSAEPQATNGSSPPERAVQVRATEAMHRTLAAGARYSTQDGPGVKAYFEHRNLSGANETGRMEMELARDQQLAGLKLSKPQYLRAGQRLSAALLASREADDAFTETAFRSSAALERQLGQNWTVSGGLALEHSRVSDNDQPGISRLMALPLRVEYDGSNNRLDPSTGVRARIGFTPYAGTFRDDTLLFAVTELGGSLYWPLGEAGKHVLALRTRLATLTGASRDDVPAPKRLYAGGGGSVRAFEYRFVGPLDAQGDPQGGRSALELGLEARLRLNDSFALVPFIDAGTVSDAELPNFDAGLQVGAGLGVRYYTAIGPFRADVAVPFNRRDADDPFQFYISIGQAF